MKAYKLNQTGSLTTRLLPFGIGVVLITGILIYVARTGTLDQKVHSNEAETPSTTIASLPSALLPVDRVKELVDDQKPGLSIAGIELERQDTGVAVYEVKLTDGSVIAFNAQSGAQVATSGHVDLTNETGIPVDTVKQIGFDKAREIALAQKPQGKVQKIELEFESGVLVYRVYFVDGSRVDVRAMDGVIVAYVAGNISTNQPTAYQSTGAAMKLEGAGGDTSVDVTVPADSDVIEENGQQPVEAAEGSVPSSLQQVDGL